MDFEQISELVINTLNNYELKRLLSVIKKEIVNPKYYLYVIRNKITNEYYIGSTYDIDTRLRSHMHPSMTSLSKNKWELIEKFIDEDYEIIQRIKLKHVKRKDIHAEETQLILEYIEKGHTVINKVFPMSLDKFL